MKKIICGSILVFFFSCEEAIDVDLSFGEPQLVIDAIIGFNEGGGSPIIFGQVELTLTTPFFEEENPAAENATVQIIDEQTGEIFQLEEDDPGVFRSGFPVLQFDRDYTLEVFYDNQLFRATERLEPTGTIDNIEQGNGFLFDEDNETEVIITFSDVPGQRNFFLFSFGFENFLVTDDEFFENGNLTFSFFYEDLGPGELVTITLLGIDQDFANYAEQVIVQADGGNNGAGGFGIPPGAVRGNIVNTTDPNNFPFGYFAISEFDLRLFELQ